MLEDARWEERAAALVATAPTAQERHHRQAVLRDLEARLRADGLHQARAHPDRGRQFAPCPLEGHEAAGRKGWPRGLRLLLPAASWPMRAPV